MKRLLMFVLVCALSACEKDNPVNTPNNGLEPITFGEAVTRANITTDDITANGFGVYAFVNTGANGTSGDGIYESLLGDNSGAERVYIDTTTGDWTYGNTKFWLADRVYQFLGVYPYNAPYTITTASGNPTGISRTFTTPAAADEDLVLARATYDTSVATPESVEMNFEHMLANVNFKVWRDEAKHQNDQMRVKKVTLSNVRMKGTYYSATNAWEMTNDKMAMEYTNNTLADEDNIGAAVTKADGSWDFGGEASTPFSGLLLIPQNTNDASNSISLKIEYELKRQNAVDWETKVLEADLPSIAWKAGQRYTYNVVLSSVTYITVYYIQTTVDPWGTPQVGGTVIIK